MTNDINASNINTFKSIADVVNDNRVNGKVNLTEVLQTSGLAGWNVQQTPVMYRPVINGEEGQLTSLSGNYVTYRSDNGYAFPNVVKQRYTIVQNEQGFAFLENIAGIQSLTGGLLTSGCFIMGHFGEINVLGDTVRNYILFKNSFDGSTKFIVALTPIRVLDNSVLNISAGAGMFAVGVKHTPTVSDRLTLAQNILKHQQSATNGLVETANKAVNVKIAVNELEAKIRAILVAGTPQRVKGVDNKISDAAVQQVISRYYSSDIVRFVGTGYGLILAIAKYVNEEVIKNAKNKELAVFNKCLLSPNPLITAAVNTIIP